MLSRMNYIKFFCTHHIAGLQWTRAQLLLCGHVPSCCCVRRHRACAVRLSWGVMGTWRKHEGSEVREEAGLTAGLCRPW